MIILKIYVIIIIQIKLFVEIKKKIMIMMMIVMVIHKHGIQEVKENFFVIIIGIYYLKKMFTKN